MDQTAFTYSSSLKFILMIGFLAVLIAILVTILPFSFISDYWIFIFISLVSISYYQTSRSLFVKISFNKNEITYKGLFKRYIIRLEEFSNIYIYYYKFKNVKGRKPNIVTTNVEKLTRFNDLNKIDYLKNAIIILLTHKHNVNERECWKYPYISATKDYITFEYRNDASIN